MKQQSMLSRLQMRKMILVTIVVLPILIGLLALVTSGEAWRSLGTFERIAWLGFLLANAIALVLMFWTTQRALKPIRQMTSAALAAAQGDLSQKVAVQGGSELEALAQAFNTMTEQVQGRVTNLENLVAERTAELTQRTEAMAQSNRQNQRRVAQLEASAKVAQGVASMLDTDQLLEQAVDLISEAFGHYHTGILHVGR